MTTNQEITLPIQRRHVLLGRYLVGVVIIVLSLFYLGIPDYLFVVSYQVEWKFIYYILFILITPFLLLNPKSFTRYLFSPFSLWALALLIISSVGMLGGPDIDKNVVSLVSTQNQYIILTILFGFIFSITPTKHYERIIPILAMIIPLLVIIDFIRPGILYPLGTIGTMPGRAGATFINPNKAGEAMLLTGLLAIPVMRPKYRICLILLTFLGIIMTFSRGAILVWTLFCFFLLKTRKIPLKGSILIIAAFIFMPTLLGCFKYYLEARQDLGSSLNDVITRLSFFQNPTTFTDASAQLRVTLLQEGWDLFLHNPILGAGTGATTFWDLGSGTHNEFLKLAAEHGIFGIALWVTLAVILWKGEYFEDRRFQFAAAGMFIFSSFFTHNMFDFPYWLFTFALISGQRRFY